MVRQKHNFSAEKMAELDKLISETKVKFDNDLKELELAKRHFSLDFVERMETEFAKIFPEEVLNMKLTDYVKHLEAHANEVAKNSDKEGGTVKGTASTPAFPRRPITYKTMKTPAGLNIRVPSCITPKVETGTARACKFGEVLFSMHGTPVAPVAGSSNGTEGAVNEWLQQEENLTPQSRDIVAQLKKLMHLKEAKKDDGGEAKEKQ
ncbi:hypothetical protein niasHT_023157 [Heterodera trifolii]|uniref:Borealin N-terminal domain-containing protein n=1 Tax=Heterodera trifolii TaxID=157864 RepID=A0ABD2JE32_9BILA